MNFTNYNIKLASQSPRRKDLLTDLGLDFEILSGIEVEETYPDNTIVEEIPVFLAKKKADAYKNTLAHTDLLITADTIVSLQGKVLNKPTSLEDAKKMLAKLSGNMHRVISGVCITSNKKQITFNEITEVYFNELTTDEIDFYVNKYKPLDKAGAYGIQEWIGYIGIEKITGSFYNVMGLPIQKVYKQLLAF